MMVVVDTNNEIFKHFNPLGFINPFTSLNVTSES